MSFQQRIAGLFGFLAVALGAFGAHGLEPLLEGNGHQDTWETASLYHLTHAIVLLVVSSCFPTARVAFWLFATGITIFSGSLYTLALTDYSKLGMITPIGGLCLLAGWGCIFLKRKG